jgi:hypothetical protein
MTGMRVGVRTACALRLRAALAVRSGEGGHCGGSSSPVDSRPVERLDDPDCLEDLGGELRRDDVDRDDPLAAAVASGEGVADIALDAVVDEHAGVGRKASLGLKQEVVAGHAQRLSVTL